jgi:hypothetical protein
MIRYEEECVPKPDMQVQFEGKKYLIKNIHEIDTRKRGVLFMMTETK